MSRWLRFLGAVWIAWALTTAVWAADENKVIHPGSTAPASAPVEGSVGNLSLVAALLLAGVGGWLFWRGRRGGPRTTDGRALNIAETRSLGNRQYLVVATYEKKKFLLGVCADRINLLAPLHDEEPDA
jgi:flagellar protein FliO/FliZ